MGYDCIHIHLPLPHYGAFIVLDECVDATTAKVLLSPEVTATPKPSNEPDPITVSDSWRSWKCPYSTGKYTLSLLTPQA